MDVDNSSNSRTIEDDTPDYQDKVFIYAIVPF